MSYQTDLERIERLLTAAYAAYESALESVEVQTYRFESGEGTNQVTRRDPATILKQINDLEAKKTRILTRLKGTGIVNINLRRQRQ